MLRAESKDNGRILMKVEGKPVQIITELYALICAVSDYFEDDKLRGEFLDDIPSMVRSYREGLKHELRIDNSAIKKAKEE